MKIQLPRKNSATAEKISVVQQGMYKALNIKQKGINAERWPGADAFVVVLASVEEGNVTDWL